MLQQQPAIPVPRQNLDAQLGALRATANELKLHLSDLEVRRNQLAEQRQRRGADVSPAALDRQLASLEHELTATRLQIETINTQIGEVAHERDVARAFPVKAAEWSTGTAPQTPDPNLPLDQMVGAGAFLLLLPLVLAFARRIWRRSGAPTIDLENSPRLQRIEQAVEAIALEVERIGEAQRFTTKLLAERHAEVAPPLVAKPRREPGTITPH